MTPSTTIGKKKREKEDFLAWKEWKDSTDPIERTAYWINWLSPHNLWKAKDALKEMLEQARQDERRRLAEKIRGMKKNSYEDDEMALDDVLSLLSEEEKK